MAHDWRVGIIGCGGMGQLHAQAWASLEGVRLVACCDLQEAVARRLAQQWDVPHVFTDGRAMLAACPLDLAIVATWPRQHAGPVVDAARAGARAILCEKPLAPSLQEADAMLATCQQYGVRLAVGHQRRALPLFQQARQRILAGELGKVTRVWGSTNGGLLNNGSHLINLARFLLGDPPGEWAFGQIERTTNRHERGQPVEDRSLLAAGLAGDTLLCVDTDLTNGFGFVVEGSQGCLQMVGNQALRWHTERGLEEQSFPADVWDIALRLQAEQLLTALETGEPHPSEGIQARADLEIMMALYESARRRQQVSLPLSAGPSPLLAMIESGELTPSDPTPYDIRSEIALRFERGEGLPG